MNPRPLPIRVRYYVGETVTSYAARVASANGTTVEKQEHIAYLNGWITSRARNSPGRTRLWETLTRLPRGTIPRPTLTGRDKHQPHPLCIRCTQGIPVQGWLTTSGVICLKHGTAHTHTVIAATPEQVQAERAFRSHLVPAGLHSHHHLVEAAHQIALFENQQTPPEPNRGEALHLLTHYPQTVATAIQLLRHVPARRQDAGPRLLRVA